MTDGEVVYVRVTVVGRHTFVWGRLNGKGGERFIRVGGLLTAIPRVGLCIGLEFAGRGDGTITVRFANGETAEVADTLVAGCSEGPPPRMAG